MTIRFNKIINRVDERLNKIINRKDERLKILEEAKQKLTASLKDLQKKHQELSIKYRDLRKEYKEKFGEPPVAYKRMVEFVKQSHLTLPQKQFDNFIKQLSTDASADTVERYKEYLKNSNYIDLFEQLFSHELQTTRALNPRTLKEFTTFLRGKPDLDRAKKEGVHLHQLKKNMIKITDELLFKIIFDSDFTKPPENVCEIGGAWGATTIHIIKRFKPKDYQNYEIDYDYAKWSEENLGTKAMIVDGETLSQTETASQDLVIANNVLFFIPPLKVWSYLNEMARVTAKNGLIVFNILIADRILPVGLDGYLNSLFPRRTIGMVPEVFIKRSFPDKSFTLIRKVESKINMEYLPYLVFKRKSD